MNSKAGNEAIVILSSDEEDNNTDNKDEPLKAGRNIPSNSNLPSTSTLSKEEKDFVPKESHVALKQTNRQNSVKQSYSASKDSPKGSSQPIHSKSIETKGTTTSSKKISFLDEKVRRQIEAVKEQCRKRNSNKTQNKVCSDNSQHEFATKILKDVRIDKVEINTCKKLKSNTVPRDSAFKRVFSPSKTIPVSAGNSKMIYSSFSSPSTPSQSISPGNKLMATKASKDVPSSPLSSSNLSTTVNRAVSLTPTSTSSISLASKNTITQAVSSPACSALTTTTTAAGIPANSILVTKTKKNVASTDNSKLYYFTAKTLGKSVSPETNNTESSARVMPSDEVIVLDSDGDDDEKTEENNAILKEAKTNNPQDSKKRLENVVGKLLTHSTGKQTIVSVQSTSSPIRNQFIKKSPSKGIQQPAKKKKLNLESMENHASCVGQPDAKPPSSLVPTSQVSPSKRLPSSQIASSSQGIPEVIDVEQANQNKKIKKKLNKEAKIKILERKLEHLEKQIEKYAAQELSDKDMDQEESAYIQESKLKEEFMKHWRMYCKLIGEDPDYYVCSRKKIKLTSSPFPELNREVERFVNRNGSFPNLFEVKNACKQANEKYQLQLKDVDLHSCAVDLFTESGKKIQDQRKRNFRKLMYEEDSVDPAIDDPELQRKFKTNRKIAKKNTDDIFTDFVRQQMIQERFVDNNDGGENSDSEEYGDTHIESLRKRNLIENEKLKRKLITQKVKGSLSKKAKRSDNKTVINVTLAPSAIHAAQPHRKIDCHVTLNSSPSSPKAKNTTNASLHYKESSSSSSRLSKPPSKLLISPQERVASPTLSRKPVQDHQPKTSSTSSSLTVTAPAPKSVTSSTLSVAATNSFDNRTRPSNLSSISLKNNCHEHTSLQASKFESPPKIPLTNTRKIINKPVLGLDTLMAPASGIVYKPVPQMASIKNPTNKNIEPVTGPNKTPGKANPEKTLDIVIIDD